MDKNLESVCVALEDLSNSVLSSWAEDRTLQEVWNWQFPALTRQDLAAVPSNLAKKIRSLDLLEIDDSMKSLCPVLIARINLLKAQTVPYLFNGNGNVAAPGFISAMVAISERLDPLFGWERLADTQATPKILARRLRNLKAELDQITGDRDSLVADVASIRSGAEAAESLPTDLEALASARKKIAEVEKAVGKSAEGVETSKSAADSATVSIRASEAEAAQLVKKCEEAYRITTTTGLAGAFEDRSRRTARSMWVWVVGLLAALSLGAWKGAHHLEALSTVLSTHGVGSLMVISTLLTAILSVGAPIWFAWLATKQIGQRFRLAEDYGFKASLAKAYEGYRKEAARIDSELEKRLFASALTRLEELPLRLVETESHGSPWHELFKSPAFKEAVKTTPDFREKLLDVLKGLFEADLRKGLPKEPPENLGTPGKE